MEIKTIEDALKQKKKLDNLGLYFTIIAHTKKNSVETKMNKEDVVVVFTTDKKVKRKKRELLMMFIQQAYGSHFRFINKKQEHAK